MIPTPLRKKKRSIASIQSSSTDSSLMTDDGDRLNRHRHPMYGSFNQSETVTFDSADTASSASSKQLQYRIYVNSVYWGGLAFGRLSAVYISKKMNPLYMLILDLLGCFVAALLLFMFDADVNAAWIGSGLFGFSMASIFPCIFLIAEQTVKVDGKYASLMIFGASCGEFIIPWTEGNLMHTFGVKHFAAITVVLVIILFCVMLLLLLGIYADDIKKKVVEFFETE